jgi:chorismate synthase
VPAAGRTDEFALRPLRKPEEFRHAEELERSALGGEAALTVPAGLLRTVQDQGGLVLGAFVDIHLAGLTASSIGWDGQLLYHESLVTVVRPEYRRHLLGFRLKALQREEVRRLGLSELRWGFDPLERSAASLSVRRLGAVPDGYRPNYFGHVEPPDGPRDESDRLRVRWPLEAPRVERRVAGELPTPEEAARRCSGASAIVRTETGASGLRLPTEVAEPTGPGASLEIPFDLGSIRAHEPASLRRWRHAVRDGFRAAFDVGYVVDDFAAVTLEHERRCFYFLAPGTGESPPVR